MSRYAIRGRVRPHFYYASLPAGAPTIADALVEVIADVVTVESTSHPEGGEVLQVALIRPTHTEAFEDVAAAVAQAGYSMVEAEVAEVVDETATGAVVGLLGGGAPGVLVENPIVALVGAALGCWAGREVGASVKKLGAAYRYRFFPAAGWRYSQVDAEGTDLPTGTGHSPVRHACAPHFAV